MDYTINLPFFNEYASNVDFSLLQPPGREHYRLLAYLSTMFDSQDIFDIGTHTGVSAYALAYNKNNTIYTFDIVDKVTNQRIKSRDNIRFNLGDLFDETSRIQWIDLLLGSPLIFLDVDPHNGEMELKFYQFLVNNNYRGILICDDIWYFKDMRDNFWSHVPAQNKYELTPYGHWSGTGAIVFNENYQRFFPPKISTNDWTVVTTYYDLAQVHDIANARATMSIPYNLIVYCDQSNLDQIKQLRPLHLSSQTKYIIIKNDELTTIPHSRGSYRYLLMEQTLHNNPFNSKYFAWINICFEDQGFKNLMHLDKALSLHRDKFSILCDIQKTNKCTSDINISTGFFTGNLEYMTRVCQIISNKFSNVIDYDQQHIFNQMESENPELFEYYYGMITDQITNYVYVYDNFNQVMQYIIDLFNYQKHIRCYNCCRFLWESIKNHSCNLNTEQTKQILFYKCTSKQCMKNTKHCIDIPVSQVSPSTIIACLYEIDLYPELIRQILEFNFPIIIWTSDSDYDKLNNICHGKNNIIIYQKNIKSFDQYKHYGHILARCQSMSNLLMYTRTSLWIESIEANPFNTSTFICLNFDKSLPPNIRSIEKMSIPARVKLLVIDPYTTSDPLPGEYFKQSHHNLAHQLVTGNGKNLIEYAHTFNRELTVMLINRLCLSEEAIASTILRKYPEMFECYYGDESTIVSNYEKIRVNVNLFSILDKYLNSHMYSEAQYLIDKIDYDYNNELRYIFVHYSILTNYYSMDQLLNPIVIQILNDPAYKDLRDEIFKYDESNLSFYTNRDNII